MKPRNPYVRACATRRTRFEDKREAKLATIETRDLRMFEGPGWQNLKALREDAREVGMGDINAGNRAAFLLGYRDAINEVDHFPRLIHEGVESPNKGAYILGLQYGFAHLQEVRHHIERQYPVKESP